MTRITTAQVQEIEEWWQRFPCPKAEEECWKHHPRCAIASLIASHRAMEKTIEDLEYARQWDKSTIESLVHYRNNWQAEATRLREALEKFQKKQPQVLAYMREKGIVIDNLDDPMQRFAFLCYTELCEVEFISRTMLERDDEQALTGQEAQNE